MDCKKDKAQKGPNCWAQPMWTAEVDWANFDLR